MNEFTISDFYHTPPDGYSYEFTQFNTRLVAIWLHHSYPYTYTTKSVKSIWGFFSPKKREYYAPITATKVGGKVEIKNTTNYTAMPMKLSILEQYFS